MSTVGRTNYKESDGKAIEVTLVGTVEGAAQLIYAEGMFGFAHDSGDSGDTIAMGQEAQILYQVTVPSGLSVAKGDILYVDTAQVTGNIPDDAAWGTSSGGTNVAVFRVVEAKDANNVVICRFIWT